MKDALMHATLNRVDVLQNVTEIQLEIMGFCMRFAVVVHTHSQRVALANVFIVNDIGNALRILDACLLQNKIVMTRKCLPEPLAKVPQERLQNKIAIIRKCFQSLWPGVPPGKVPDQDCSNQKMHPRAFGQGSPQERLQNKTVITRKCPRFFS